MIRFSPPHIVGTEQDYIGRAIEKRSLCGNGEFTKLCEEFLEQTYPGSSVLLTTSCTHALEMMCLLTNLKPGDKVIIPAYTFVSTANAFAKFGVEPVFADISLDSLCMDVESVKQNLTPRVKAVVTVNYGGEAGDVAELAKFCQENGLVFLEDNAQGIFATHGDQPLGTFGALSALSFHATKNISCGEGGALIINDRALLERAEIIREKGTDRSRFLRGMIDKYSWTDLGSSYVISDLLAAMLLAQLHASEDIQARRKAIWGRYFAELEGWAKSQGAQLPDPSRLPEHSAHVFYLLVPEESQQTEIIGHLSERGVQATFHYQPLHLSRMGRDLGGEPGDYPVCESVSGRIVRLPLSAAHSDEEIAQVIKAVKEYKF